MLVSVLSPGPSLAKVSAIDVRDTLTIGVNRAVHHAVCDWWCFGDDRMYRTYATDYSPRIACNEESQRRLKLDDCVTWESLYQTYSPACHWYLYSFTSALVVAASLGATDINVYGCDWSGVEDFDGHQYQFKHEEAAVTRTPDRWQREREIYYATTAMLLESGVKVNRINGNV